jgi:hypothetical protein
MKTALTKLMILSGLVALAGFSAQAQTGASASTFVTIRPPLNPPTGVVTDRFNVGSNLQGLTYANQDEFYGPTLFYSIRNDNAGNSTFTTISSLTSTTAGRMSVGNHAFDAVTFAAPDVGYGPTIFYSLSHDIAGNSTFGTIQPTGVPYTALFRVGQNFDALTFSATDVGYGANLFYSLSHDNFGNSTFGTINPTPGGIVHPLFTVGMNFDELVFTATDVGYGADMFYYLRTDQNGNSIFGTIDAIASFTGPRVVDRFSLGAPFEELTFTTTDVGYGPNLFYSLRSGAADTGGSGDIGGTSVPDTGSTLLLLGSGLVALGGLRRRLLSPA